MEFMNVFSSVVLVGENFTPALFKDTDYFSLLGEPDNQEILREPSVLYESFPSKGVKVFLTPERIDFGQEEVAPIPADLMELLEIFISKMGQTENPTVTGVGVNLDTVISSDVLSMAGAEFCRQFLNLSDLRRRIGDYDALSNSFKLVYLIGAVQYTVDVQPFDRSAGRDLVVKVNAHQEVPHMSDLDKALKRFSTIWDYLAGFHERFLGLQI